MHCEHCHRNSSAPGITLGDWSAEYLQLIHTRDLSTKTLDGRKRHVGQLVALLGGPARPLASIRPVDIAQAIRTMWDTGKEHTALRLYIEAGEMFSEAINAGLAHLNPVIHVKRPRPQIRRSRLTLDQYIAIRKRLARSGAQWLIDMMDIALITGQRLADVSSAARSNVVDDHLLITQQKTGVRLAIPLDIRLAATRQSLRKIIERCQSARPDSDLLVSRSAKRAYSKNYVSTAFASARDDALPRSTWPEGRRPATFHEIRSLSERLYRDEGYDTKALLGHKRQSTTDQYNDDRDCIAAAFKAVRLPGQRKGPSIIRLERMG